jgi:hypothetical protein
MFAHWTLDGVQVSGNPYTLRLNQAGHILTPLFKALPVMYTWTMAKVPNAQVNPMPGPHTIPPNSKAISIVGTALNGYKWKGWNIDGTLVTPLQSWQFYVTHDGMIVTPVIEAPTPPPTNLTVQITKPVGGETFNARSLIAINWSAAGGNPPYMTSMLYSTSGPNPPSWQGWGNGRIPPTIYVQVPNVATTQFYIQFRVEDANHVKVNSNLVGPMTINTSSRWERFTHWLGRNND